MGKGAVHAWAGACTSTIAVTTTIAATIAIAVATTIAVIVAIAIAVTIVTFNSYSVTNPIAIVSVSTAHHPCSIQGQGPRRQRFHPHRAQRPRRWHRILRVLVSEREGERNLVECVSLIPLGLWVVRPFPHRTCVF
jgi:hypothetical protein